MKTTAFLEKSVLSDESLPLSSTPCRVICPSCRSGFNTKDFTNHLECHNCGRRFPVVCNMPDLRIFSDRYLSLNQERQKARRLAATDDRKSLEEWARAYYRMTADVSPTRRERFVRHITHAHFRGAALLGRLPSIGSILEVGCGTGGFLAAAAHDGRNVTGVDIASRWLVVARKRLREMKLDCNAALIPACAEALPWPDASFDCVVADSLLEHLSDPMQCVREMLRVVRPGGTVCLWSPNRYYIGVDPHVGLWGLGFLPRHWAEKYKTMRRGQIFLPPLNSPRQWARLIQSNHSVSDLVACGAIFSEWPLADRSTSGRMARNIGRLSKIPPFRTLLTNFGPVGEIRFKKPLAFIK